MKKCEYKVLIGDKGFAELEKTVGVMLDNGWRIVGGIGFNNGIAHQAMARAIETPELKTEEKPTTKDTKYLTANEANQKLDDII